MRFLTILLLVFAFNMVNSQVLYDPQSLYDSPGELYDHDSLRTLSINFYDANYDSILQANWTANSGLRLPATVQLDNNTVLDSVAIRYKGNSTYAIPQGLNNPKLPLNLDFNFYIKGQKLMGYKKVKLSNGAFDPTFCKEVSAYNIYRRYLPSPEANHMKVNLQGNYLGLYVNTEAVDRKFLKKHFHENDGILFKCDPIQQFGQPGPSGNSDLTWKGNDTTLYYNHYTIKSDHGWTELKNLIYTINYIPSQIDSVLNVDRVLWAFAANTVLANLDTYNGLYQHNYYLYRTEDGLFQMIPWDLSESYVGALLQSNSDPDSLYEYDPFYGYNSWWTPLNQQLIADTTSLYSKIYAAHIRTILEESLIVNDIKAHVTDLQNNISTAVNTDPNKFFNMVAFTYNVDNEYIVPFVFSAAGITSTVNKRKPFLQSHPQIDKTPPDITDVNLISSGGNIYATTEVFNADSVELLYTINKHYSKFRKVLMFDDGTNGDAVAGDNTYTVLLPEQNSGKHVKFYVRAHNDEAIKLNPERAEYEFYVYAVTNQIEEEPELVDFNIYPNPTQNYLYIDFGDHQFSDIQILDNRGRLVLNPGVVSSINLEPLSGGIYFIKLTGNNNTIIKRIVKN